MNCTLRNRPRFVLGIMAAAIWLWALPVAAQEQQPATPPATPPAESGTPASAQAPAPTTSASSTSTGQTGQNAVNNDRIFGMLPNYATVETEHQFGPLT